ncbi:MAG: outer membrane beta-barrel protein [Fluviicola sp.]|nr:outer membrane beta-barrel protein [Fluviicola sp.]
MKKVIIAIAFLGIISSANAQEAADKKVQAGLVFGAGMNIQKMGTKKLAADGIGSLMTIGANLNYTFNETVGITFGVEFDFETLKYKQGPSPVYYYYNDNTILSKTEASSDPNAELYQLTARKQKPIYLTIPIMALFRTKFIGYFRYFGKFGLRNSFLLSNKTFDQGTNYPLDLNPIAELATIGANDNMQYSKSDMDFFKSSVGLAGGAEWNFTGSTSLVLEVGYYYGFVDIYWDRNEDNSSLFTTDATGLNPAFFNNSVNQSQIQFKLSILF